MQSGLPEIPSALPEVQSTTKKKQTEQNRKQSQVIRILYFWFLIAVITIGIEGAVRKGSLTEAIQLFPQLGFLSIPEIPTSPIIFGGFGFILYKKFHSYSILMLLSTYCSWELFATATLSNGVHNIILHGYSGTPNPIIMSVWGLVILFSYYIIQPKVNLNNWFAVIAFIYCVQEPLIYAEYYPDYAHVLLEFVWCAMIYKSFSHE